MLAAALVAMALVTGLIFTFSVAVMPNLASVDDRTFVLIMQRFNNNPVFPLSFTTALALAACAAVLQRRNGPGVAVRWTVVALVLYGLVVAVTAGLHIPLNEEITQAGNPDRIADLADVRDRFEAPWVAGNIVRALLSTAAVAALAHALFLHGRGTTDRTTGAHAREPSWAPLTFTAPTIVAERAADSVGLVVRSDRSVVSSGRGQMVDVPPTERRNGDGGREGGPQRDAARGWPRADRRRMRHGRV